MYRRPLFDAAHTVGLYAGLEQDERAEHPSPKEAETIDRFEQLAPGDLDGDVMHPNPESILDPLEPRLRIFRLRRGQGGAKGAMPIPEDRRIFNSVQESPQLSALTRQMPI